MKYCGLNVITFINLRMKTLFAIALLLFGLTNYAQEKKSENKKNKTEQMSPEQKNELQLKKMTLNLNLNETQQKEMSVVVNEMSEKRESQKNAWKAMKEKGEKPTAEQKYEMQDKMLDEKIAMKTRVQKILTPSQFEKWEQMKQKNYNHTKQKKEQKSETMAE